MNSISKNSRGKLKDADIGRNVGRRNFILFYYSIAVIGIHKLNDVTCTKGVVG